MQAPEWVRERLDGWGRWMSERGVDGLGFPRSNILALHRGAVASTDHVPVDSVAAGHTHRAVSMLRVDRVSQWMAVQCRYVGNPQQPAGRRRPMTYSEIGALLGVTDATASTWVSQAELAVAHALSQWGMSPVMRQ
jgi:hypothetical protein